METIESNARKTRWLEIALLALLVFATVGLFSNRAVFSDENIYLKIAQSALTNPLFPSDTPLLFFGIQRSNYAAHTHPPVGEYYLAGIFVLLERFSEVPFRLLFSPFPIMAVLAFYALARRFTNEPFFVAVLFAVCPAFFVMAPTLMMDIPVVALLLAGLALYFNGRLIAAAVSFILAVGTGYTALVPLTCLGLIMLISRRPLKELACIASAPAALAVWLAAMTVHFGEFPLKQTLSYLLLQGVTPRPVVEIFGLKLTTIGLNTLATLSFLGGVLVFPGTIRLKQRRSWIAAAGLAAILSLLAPPSLMPTFIYRLWFAVLAMFGIMILAACVGSAIQIVRSGINNGGEPVLILWVPAVLLFFIFVAEVITARYLLLAVPPIYLIIFRETSRSDLMATIVPTAGLSLILAYADTSFVNSYRNWVENNVAELQEQGFSVYSAAESGLRFNLEDAGADALVKDDRRPVGPDIVVRQEMFGYSLGEDIEVVLTELKPFPLEGSFPIRTFSPNSRAGFWGSVFGLTPYVLSSKPYDVIHVTQVSPLVLGFPQASTDPGKAVVFSPEGPLLKQSERDRFFPMRFPSNIQIQYDLVGGMGSVEQTPDGLRLINGSESTIEWRRLRFMPIQWTRDQ